MVFNLKKTVYLFWAWTVFSVLISPLWAWESPIELTSHTEKTEYALNEEVLFIVELRWKGEMDRIHLLEIHDPDMENLSLRSSGSTNRIETDPNGNNIALRRITYYLNPDRVGAAKLSNMSIIYEDVSTSKKATLYPRGISLNITQEKYHLSNENITGTIIIWLVFTAFILIILVAILRYFKNRATHDEVAQTPPSAQEVFKANLKEQITFNGRKTKEEGAIMATLLTQYIQQISNLESGVDLKRCITFLQENGYTETVVQRLKEHHEQLEQSRFAGTALSTAQLHRFYDTCEQIINETTKRSDI